MDLSTVNGVLIEDENGKRELLGIRCIIHKRGVGTNFIWQSKSNVECILGF